MRDRRGSERDLAAPQNRVHLDDDEDGAARRNVRIAASSGGNCGLTRREQEVLQLVRQGLTNEEIARALWVSLSTVKVHMRHIFAKLGVRSRTQAALWHERR